MGKGGCSSGQGLQTAQRLCEASVPVHWEHICSAPAVSDTLPCILLGVCTSAPLSAENKLVFPGITGGRWIVIRMWGKHISNQVVKSLEKTEVWRTLGGTSCSFYLRREGFPHGCGVLLSTLLCLLWGRGHWEPWGSNEKQTPHPQQLFKISEALNVGCREVRTSQWHQ